jgi:hypothetical protein
MEKLICVYPYVFVNGIKVGGVSKIDYETKTVTCFDPDSYNSETKCYNKREVQGDITFFIKENISAARSCLFDGKSIISEPESCQV